MKPTLDLDSLRAISILKVAHSLGCELHRHGKRYVMCCPWHPDRHPSLTLYEGNGENHCHCFACGKDGSVIDLVMAKRGCSFPDACQWLERQFTQSASADASSVLPVTSTVAQPQELTFVPAGYVSQTVSMHNSFSQCLMQLFGYEEAHRVTQQYQIGVYTSRDGCVDTIFWSIDEQGRVHNGKVQRYCTDMDSPSFAHCEVMFSHQGNEYRSYWLTNVLKREGVVDANCRLDCGCPFGSHLLAARPYDRVALVESPKNAVIGAVLYPGLVWIATGNMGALKAEHLQCLKGRRVLVFPDRDATDLWREGLRLMDGLAHFSFSTLFADIAPEGQPKYDIADYIIERQLLYLSSAAKHQTV